MLSIHVNLKKRLEFFYFQATVLAVKLGCTKPHHSQPCSRVGLFYKVPSSFVLRIQSKRMTHSRILGFRRTEYLYTMMSGQWPVYELIRTVPSSKSQAAFGEHGVCISTSLEELAWHTCCLRASFNLYSCLYMFCKLGQIWSSLRMAY